MNFDPGFCDDCDQGSYKSATRNGECDECEAGTYQSAYGATTCNTCITCTDDQYRISGCTAWEDNKCAPCSTCGTDDVLRACTNTTDTVCGNAQSCNATQSSRVFPWIGEAQRCRPGEYLWSYDTVERIKDCRPCPEGWAGLNGVYCERCGPLEAPYFLDRSSCVCVFPAVVNASGACVCPAGHRLVSGTCAPCELNTYGHSGNCWACGAGKFTAGQGASACQSCPVGQYRLSGQQRCQSCSLRGWFAPVPSSATCVQCNTSCTTPGWRLAEDCPGDSTGKYGICMECPVSLPSNASWVPVSETNVEECSFNCLPGFYHADGSCVACTALVCPAGWNASACTPFADANCDQACVDAEKPTIYSHWKEGTACSWGCDDGYELRVWDYVVFKLRECAPSQR